MTYPQTIHEIRIIWHNINSMKTKCPLLATTLIFLTIGLTGQTNPSVRLFVPYLDQESQSNVIVTIAGRGEPCPPEYTNTLSNTNLFTPAEQNVIREIFEKYKHVTTNTGPPGTVLTTCYRTNWTFTAMGRNAVIERWVARFRYTNSDAQEELRIGNGGLWASFRNGSGDGYSISFNHTGDGTMLRFTGRKRNLIDGVLAAFEDMHWQGTNWDYKLADFSNCRLVEYRQYTNGMVLGKFLMWDPRSNNLFLDADFKEPYDFEKHRIDLNLVERLGR